MGESFGTLEQQQKLLNVIMENQDKKGALIPVLQKAQEIYGYLPIEVQSIIANEMRIPLAKIYGVVTFYTQFFLNKKGEHQINVCLGTACYVKGSGKILEKIEDKLGVKVGQTSSDGKFSVDATRCIGACGLAPVLTIGEDVHGRLAEDDIYQILDKYM